MRGEDGSAGLLEQVRRLETLAASAPEYILQLNREGVIQYMNRPVPGYTLEDVRGSDVRRWIEPEAHDELDRVLAAVFADGQNRSYASVGKTSGRHFDNRVAPVWNGGVVESVILVSVDVTERWRAEQRLSESEERFRTLVEGAFEGLIVWVGARVAVANEALGRMFGCRAEEMLGVTARDFCTPESFQRIVDNTRSGSLAPYEITGVRRDGSTFPCEVLGRNIVYLGKPARLTALRDLTERQRMLREREELEEQMRMAQKLESLGVLAGGIAHDFNNVLMAVLANADLILTSIEAPQQAERASAIREAALRGRELTRQLLDYASRGPLCSDLLDLGGLVHDTVALISFSISKKAELELALPSAPATVTGDGSQLRQVIMNLVINASEALAEREGRIAIGVRTLELQPADLEGCVLLPERELRRAVELSVSDSGQGMDGATIARIFDPFFSTKFTGRGLGLASVLSIVRGHHGALRVRSRLGEGTEFKVWLPETPRAPEDGPGAGEGSAERVSHTGRGLVLVADDEPLLRETARQLLETLGYEVVLAADGEDALRAFEAHADRVRLLLLDLTMPKLSGVEALRRIRARGSRVPAICTSGFGTDDVQAELAHDPFTRFLAKPYTMSELEAALDNALDAARRAH